MEIFFDSLIVQFTCKSSVMEVDYIHTKYILVKFGQKMCRGKFKVEVNAGIDHIKFCLRH